MNWRRNYHLLMVITLFISAKVVGATDSVLIATDVQSPPWEMMRGSEISGVSSDTIRLLFEALGIPYQFSAQSWPRAYDMAINRRQTCVTSVVRSPNREKLFKWIGPIARENWVLYGRADRDISVSGLNDLVKYRIGAFGGDAEAMFLREHGVTAEEVTSGDGYRVNLKKLMNDRIDLWATGDFEGAYAVRTLGYDNLRPVYVMREGGAIYLACNPSLTDELVARLNERLQIMDEDGSLEELRRSYLRQVVHNSQK